MSYIDLAVRLIREGRATDKLQRILNESRKNVPGNSGTAGYGKVADNRNSGIDSLDEEINRANSGGTQKYGPDGRTEDPAAMRRGGRDLGWFLCGQIFGGDAPVCYILDPGTNELIYDNLPSAPLDEPFRSIYLDPSGDWEGTASELHDNVMVLPVGNLTAIVVVMRVFSTYGEAKCQNFEGFVSPLPLPFQAEAHYCAWVVNKSSCRLVEVPELFKDLTYRPLAERAETPLYAFPNWDIGETQCAWAAWRRICDEVLLHAYQPDTFIRYIFGDNSPLDPAQRFSYPFGPAWHTPLIYTAILNDQAYKRSEFMPVTTLTSTAVLNPPYVTATNSDIEPDLLYQAWGDSLTARYGSGTRPWHRGEFYSFVYDTRGRGMHDPQHWLIDIFRDPETVIKPPPEVTAKTIAYSLFQKPGVLRPSYYIEGPGDFTSNPVSFSPGGVAFAFRKEDAPFSYDPTTFTGNYSFFEGKLFEVPRDYLWNDVKINAAQSLVDGASISTLGQVWRIPWELINGLPWDVYPDGSSTIYMVPFDEWGKGEECAQAALLLGFQPEDLTP